MSYSELLIGAGSRREKLMSKPGHQQWSNLTTLDINADHQPDVVWDLRNRPLPFEDNTYDEIHAYEVLEHLGTQGDYETYFAEFSEFWRILKPDGLLNGTSPSLSSRWLWGDPGHTRVISPECFVFLNQEEYTRQIGQTAMTDYRFIYQADFELLFQQENEGTFFYSLKAHKPSRISV